MKDNYKSDEKNNFKITKKIINDICASFQEAIVDTLVYKAINACEKFKLKELVIGGGVAANSRFRFKMNEAGKKAHINVRFADKKYSGDNAAMIALCAWNKLKAGKNINHEIDINPNLSISEAARQRGSSAAKQQKRKKI